jgi:hypothetical protein
MRYSTVALAGSLALAASPFLPWMRLGNVGLRGIPDPAGFFVLALGVLGVMLSLVGMIRSRDLRKWVGLVGLGALTALLVIWRTGPTTIADRAQARAEALAIVDNVPIQPVPAVRLGVGLYLGLAAAAVIALVGVSTLEGGQPAE